MNWTSRVTDRRSSSASGESKPDCYQNILWFQRPLFMRSVPRNSLHTGVQARLLEEISLKAFVCYSGCQGRPSIRGQAGDWDCREKYHNAHLPCAFTLIIMRSVLLTFKCPFNSETIYRSGFIKFCAFNRTSGAQIRVIFIRQVIGQWKTMQSKTPWTIPLMKSCFGLRVNWVSQCSSKNSNCDPPASENCFWTAAEDDSTLTKKEQNSSKGCDMCRRSCIVRVPCIVGA